MRINNNVTAMNTHRMYTNNNASVAKSVSKLSSGYRINSAADDAAGLAISEKMRAQIRGLSMASKNSQDAQSLVQTAEGALQETHNILQRMRELAVQSGSDTNEQTVDRAALQQEFAALKAEIDDIASKTRFNDQNLIDGTFQKDKVRISGDTDASGWLGISVDRAKGGTYALTATGVEATTITGSEGEAAEVTIAAAKQGTATAAKNDFGAGTTAIDLTFTAINTAAHNGMTYTLQVDGSNASNMTFTLVDSSGNKVANALNVDTTLWTGETAKIAFEGVGELTFDVATETTLTDDIAGASAVKGLLDGAELEFDTAGEDIVADKIVAGYVELTLGSETVRVGLNDTKADFKNIGVQMNFNKITDADFAAADDKFTDGDIVIDAYTGQNMIIQSGANQGDELQINIDAMNTGKLGIAFSSIATRVDASKAITEVNSALNEVSTQRAALGAISNRLDHKIANLDTSAENLTAAESRIRDVDMAKEMTNFTKNNILAQASTAMLAQANSLPQGVLQLLG